MTEIVCRFPGCNRHPEKNGYCIGHRIYASGSDTVKVSDPVRKPLPRQSKPIPKKSEKRKVEEKEYKKIVAEMLKESNICELRTPDCTLIAQGLHHKKKREGNYLNRKYLLRSCNACNLYVELHPQWALDNGLSISKHQKEKE